jgi:hypothetical protein
MIKQSMLFSHSSKAWHRSGMFWSLAIRRFIGDLIGEILLPTGLQLVHAFAFMLGDSSRDNESDEIRLS